MYSHPLTRAKADREDCWCGAPLLSVLSLWVWLSWGRDGLHSPTLARHAQSQTCLAESHMDFLLSRLIARVIF